MFKYNRHLPRSMTQRGIAYGFLNYGSDRTALETELGHARETSGTPSDLELTINEGVASLKGNPDIDELLAQAHRDEVDDLIEGTEYVMTATYGPSNLDAARELGHVFDQVSLSKTLAANLANADKQPVMEIAYRGTNGTMELL